MIPFNLSQCHSTMKGWKLERQLNCPSWILLSELNSKLLNTRLISAKLPTLLLMFMESIRSVSNKEWLACLVDTTSGEIPWLALFALWFRATGFKSDALTLTKISWCVMLPGASKTVRKSVFSRRSKLRNLRRGSVWTGWKNSPRNVQNVRRLSASWA